MAVVQTGSGWYNPDRGTLTTYDPNTGQLITKGLDPGVFGDRNNPLLLQQIQNGQLQGLFDKGLGSGLSGRSNVNIGGQVGLAAAKIMKDYPQMTKESAMKYANKWIMDRIASGRDANEIEDFAKGALRDGNAVGDEMIKGITGMISKDEFDGTANDATGASMAPDPKQSIQDELREFAGRMMMTVGPDSPQAQRISELAAAAGNKYATASGMGPGGLTTRAVGATAARAHTDLQTQREGIGLQALAAAGNQQLSVDQAQTALQAQNQQAGVLNASGVGGLIGSGVGLIGGLVASAYGGGAALPGLVAAGGAGGQAIGGLVQNGGSPTVTYGGGQKRSSYAGNMGSS